MIAIENRISDEPKDHSASHLDGALNRLNPGMYFASNQYIGLYAPIASSSPIIVNAIAG